MKTITLAGTWTMKEKSLGAYSLTVPGTVLKGLLDNHVIEDPYYGTNEEKAREYLKKDWTFEKKFTLPKDWSEKEVYLSIASLMTIADIYLNGKKIASSKDMMIPLKIRISKKDLSEENLLQIRFLSPYTYIENYPNASIFETFAVTEKKSPVIRQSNYMFGWDWGANLADMGILGNIELLTTDIGYLESYSQTPITLNNKECSFQISTQFNQIGEGKLKLTLSYHQKKVFETISDLKKENVFPLNIKHPHLWYPIGYGKQELYQLKIEASNGKEVQVYSYDLALREIQIDTKKDQYGRDMEIKVNGIPVFAKGLNFVPEDNLVFKIAPERTKKLLSLAKEMNANVIRVWGGGYYPGDDFYSYCDQNGILVFQDLMFACASYDVDDKDFLALVEKETIVNLRRIRNHACLALITGNNEIEDGVRGHGYRKAVSYEKMFLHKFKELVEKNTYLPYFPSSPTSGSPLYAMPNDMDFLDCHYWDWTGQELVFERFVDLYPRFLSEFGIVSFPLTPCVDQFWPKEEQNLKSKTTELHQKKPGGMDIINTYLKIYDKKPEDFSDVIYDTNALSAYGATCMAGHLRSHQERCHGFLYWQLNDDYPAISWSVIDYSFGVKPVYYALKHCYQKEFIYAEKVEEKIEIFACHQSKKKKYLVRIEKKNLNGKVLSCQEKKVEIPDYSSEKVTTLPADLKENEYLKLELLDAKGNVLAHFCFRTPFASPSSLPHAKYKLKQINPNTVTIHAESYLKTVFLSTRNHENITFSDNAFTMEKGEEVSVEADHPFDVDELLIQTENPR